MERVLVTGSAGFIGSHMVRALSTSYKIIPFDLVDGQDIRDKQMVAAYLKKYTPSIVLHLAALASNINSFSHPHDTFETNVLGTIHLVEASKQVGVRRFIYAGSMMAANTSSYYGISKAAAEQFVMATTSLNVTSLRMFNVYGPGQSITNPYQGVLAIFIGNVLRGEPITVYGDGKQSRDFIYIDDVVRLWRKSVHDKKTFGNVLEVGSGRATSINALARAIAPKNYPIVRKPARPGDMRLSRAKTKTPGISLSEGLQRTLAWALHNSSTMRSEE